VGRRTVVCRSGLKRKRCESKVKGRRQIVSWLRAVIISESRKVPGCGASIEFLTSCLRDLTFPGKIYESLVLKTLVKAFTFYLFLKYKRALNYLVLSQNAWLERAGV
jgi:hypothetical protein